MIIKITKTSSSAMYPSYDFPPVKQSVKYGQIVINISRLSSPVRCIFGLSAIIICKVYFRYQPGIFALFLSVFNCLCNAVLIAVNNFTLYALINPGTNVVKSRTRYEQYNIMRNT